MKNLFHTFFLISFITFSIKAQNPCNNVNFESTSPGTYTAGNAVTGWTISSQTVTSCGTSTNWATGSPEFSVVSTPIFGVPYIGTLGNSPLGGSNVAKLNNYGANNLSTRLTRTIQVTNQNTLFQFAFAGIFEGGSHYCCESSGLKILMKDNLGNTLPCYTLGLNANGSGCPNGATGYSMTSSVTWMNWQVRSIDLSPFTGSFVSIEITVNDCIYGDHYGTVFFDAGCPSPFFAWCTCGIPGFYPPPPSVNYCAGSGIASINAPLGYATYSWVAPPGTGTISPSNATVSTLWISNPLPGAVYTVQLTTPSGCVYIATYMIAPSQVNISALGSSSTCVNGTSGSATVGATGSGAGYNYSWLNSTNSVVGTQSVINNLGPGTYSIIVTALNAPGCGTAVSTVTVNTGPPGVIDLLKPYCNNQAYVCAPTTGTNYQWYNGLSAISASLGGSASCYTITSPTNGQVIYVSYLSSQGCRDSVKYTLIAAPPGSVGVTYNKLICQGANNGVAVISVTPAQGSPQGGNWFYVNSIGTTSLYSATVNPTASNSFTANNLSANGTYSVNAFDGACLYATTFSANTLPAFNYTIAPSSPTLCPGNQIPATITFTAPPTLAQYTYSWSPTTFLAGNMGTLQNTIITPTAALGVINTVIYTVVVTPSVANCPLTKTLSITAANPAPPIITPVPPICKTASNYSVMVNPPGGNFSGANPSFGQANGIIYPSVASVNTVYNFTYAVSVGSCVAKSTSTYVVIAAPTLTISGNSSICKGQSTTLLANGANTYTWSNNLSGPLISVSPTVTTSYSVAGTSAVTSCSNSATVTINILPSPTISLSGNFTICEGETASVSASGASTYTWSNNVTGSFTTLTPTVTNSYTVIGASAALCTSSKAFSITVNDSPLIQVTGNLSICQGQTVTLSASGASSYTWSNNAYTPTTAVSPNASTNYTVIGSNASGTCFQAKVIGVTVSNCTGIQGYSNSNDQIKIYPNPSNGYFFLETTSPAKIIIYNEFGSLLAEKSLDTGINIIDISELSNGIYFLRSKVGGEIRVIKISKTD